MMSKHCVVYLEANATQVLYKKDGYCACVTLTKWMNLPQTTHKASNMNDDFIRSQTTIAKIALLFQIILDSAPQFLSIAIKNSIPIKYPFFLRYIVISHLSGMFEYSFKATAMNFTKPLS